MGTEDLLIRVARESDAREMHDLHARSVAAFCRGHYSDDQVKVLLIGRTPEGYLPAIEHDEMFVMESDGRMVGFGHATQGEVQALFVDPDWAGRGVGSALLEHALRLAERGHDGPIQLKSTLNAVGFYEAHGFVEVEPTELNKHGVALPFVLMEQTRPVALVAYNSMAEAYAAAIEENPRSTYYERPALLGLLPDVSGLRVLDAGCGPGVMVEWFLTQGAEVVGVDVSANMLKLTRQRVGDAAVLHVADLEQPMPFLADSSFDVILSSGTLGYVRDWLALFREFSRVLRPGGCVVFSVGHPCSEYTLNETDDYFSTELREYTWRGLGAPIVVPCYRRPLSHMIDPMVRAGFDIERVVEPVPTEEFAEVNPQEYAQLMRRPRVLCVRARKPVDGA
ncbi:MAG: GNAT family N-acetyltransferase [Candidatus Eisenbacteria sp.]|nr:GNAT family N-acetyltransferase [Candidatus Eisenbacteria bacterium]